jgi:hypothetical protein
MIIELNQRMRQFVRQVWVPGLDKCCAKGHGPVVTLKYMRGAVQYERTLCRSCCLFLDNSHTQGTPTSYRKEVPMTQEELDLLAALEKEAHEEAESWKWAVTAQEADYSPSYCRLHQTMAEAKEKALHNALAELQEPRTQEELP